MSNIFFNLFASLLLISLIMVVSVNNAIYSVLFLIFSFFNVMCLLLLLGVDFISLIFLIIYLGAITVLFLFVIMMIQLKTEDFGNFKFIPVFCFVVLFIFFIDIFKNNDVFMVFLNENSNLNYMNWFLKIINIDNIRMIGQIAYTYFAVYFIISGIILLIAMIGAILLSLKKNQYIRKWQNTSQQLSRCVENAIFFVY